MQLINYADRYAFIASVALFMILFVKQKDKRKKRSHKGSGLARCRRRKIYATALSNWEHPGRNSSNFEDIFLRTGLL